MSYSSEVLADSPEFYARLGDAGYGVASASSSFIGEPPSNAFDGSAGSVWDTNGTASGWLQQQLATAFVATEYKIVRRDDIPTRNPKDWVFKGSNDGTAWTSLDTQTSVTWPTSGETKTFSFSNSTAYTYYRLDVSANNGDTYLSVADMSITGLGAVMADSSGNSRNGSYGGVFTATAGLLAGDSDGAVLLDGSSQYGSTTYASWQSPATFTVEALIKPSTVSGTRTVVARHNVGGSTWTFRLEGATLKFYLWTSVGAFVTASSSVTFVAGTIYHVAATYDGTTVTVYVNGSATGTITGSLYNAAVEPIRIGAGNGELYAGTIDEVAFYSSAVSSGRIAAHYAAATTTSSPDATVAPPAAAASAAAVAPAVSASRVVLPPAASASAVALPPTIGAGGNATVSPPAAAATATARPPVFTQGLPAGTDTSNSLNGRRRRARASVVVVLPAAAAPSRAAVKYDKSVPYPPPTLVNGRPT